MNDFDSLQSASPRARKTVLLCLTLLVVAGGFLRFSGRYWDEGQGLHPDERFMMMVTSSMRFPSSDVSLFDATRSTLNPNVTGSNLFVYGTLPVYLVASAHFLVGRPLGLDLYQTGRTITALFDTGTLLLVALLGLALLGTTGAIFATAAYAFAVIPIQLSHFYTVDPYASFFCLAAIAAALRAGVADNRLLRRWALAFGALVGCAAASKLSSSPIALVLPLALWLRDRRFTEGPGMLPEDRRGRWRRIAVPTLTAAFAALFVFRFAQPYAFLGPSVFGLTLNPRWLQNMEEIRHLSTPGIGFPPNIQWYARAPWFSVEQIAWWGLSPLVFLGAVLGGCAVAWNNLRHDRWNALSVLWVWATVNLTLFGALAGVKYLRYQLPIYGCACLLFGFAITRLPQSSLAKTIGRRLGNPLQIRALSLGYGILALVTAITWAAAFTSIYRAPVTRVEASQWILRHWPGPLNFVLRTPSNEQIFEPIALRGGQLPQSLEVTFHNEGTVDALWIHRAQTGSSSSVPGFVAAPGRQLSSVTLREHTIAMRVELSRLDATPGNQSPQTTFAGNMNLRNGIAESITLNASAPILVKKGERVRLTFEPQKLPPTLKLEGTRIAHETSWDDTLPLRLDGFDPYGGIYVPDVNFQLYDPQLERIIHGLETADTISISSNRVYGTITRMGRDFPLVDHFYRQLLPCPREKTIAFCYQNAEPSDAASPLGFRLVKTVTRNPTVGPITIPDQTAEEAFTVYDHPRVLLFQRVARVGRDVIVRELTKNPR